MGWRAIILTILGAAVVLAVWLLVYLLGGLTEARH